jgi:hypothetical protein
MRYHRISIAAACQIAAAFAGVAFAEAQPANPCRQITAACRQAGFMPGAAKAGEGLQLDCIRPIMMDTAQRPRSVRPLPPIDPQIIAACKAANPSFGMASARGAGGGPGPRSGPIGPGGPPGPGYGPGPGAGPGGPPGQSPGANAGPPDSGPEGPPPTSSFGARRFGQPPPGN